MKSIWLPLALLAGTTGSALAQPNDLSTDEAISKAKLELEEARLHLEALLAEQAAADVIVEKRLAVKLAPDAEIQWGIDAGDCAEAASSCEDEAKVITKSFRIDSKGATCEVQGECDEPQTFAINIGGEALDLSGAIGQALVVDGKRGSTKTIDLGDGRTMMIQVEAMGMDLGDGPQMLAFAPDAAFEWEGDCEVEVDCEVVEDCGPAAGSCDEGSDGWYAKDKNVEVYTIGGPMGGGHGAMMFGGGPMKGKKSQAMVFGHGGGQHGGMVFGGKGGQHGGFPHAMHGMGGHDGGKAFGIFHGKGGEMFDFRGHGGAGFDFRGHGGADFHFPGQASTIEVMVRVDGGHPQWIELPSGHFGGGHAAPKAFFGKRMMQNYPMFPGMGGGHGGMTWFGGKKDGFGKGHDMKWFGKEHGDDHADLWFGEWESDCDEGGWDMDCDEGDWGMDCGGGSCDTACETSCGDAGDCDSGASFWLGTTECDSGDIAWLEDCDEAKADCDAPSKGSFFFADATCEVEVECETEVTCEVAASCETAASGCDTSKDCGTKADCDTAASCDAPASACDTAKDCSTAADCGTKADCDTATDCGTAADCGTSADCGDCTDCGGGACASAAPVACETAPAAACTETADAFFVGTGVDAEIEALIAELEDVSFGEGVHVIELHGDATGEADEIDALIAQIEAELTGELETVDFVVEVGEPILKDVEILSHYEIDEKQERIEELEAEVDELRELVESLVKELNER